MSSIVEFQLFLFFDFRFRQKLRYTLPAPAPPVNTIVYEIVDDSGALATATVTIVHSAAPPAVEAFDYCKQTGAEQPISIQLLASNVDPFLSPDDVTLTIVTPPPASDGALSPIDAFSGSVTFTPSPDFDGSTAQFTYRIEYRGAQDQGTFYIDVASCPL
jgi:Bacterial Ig domain